ncbi:hypothetical protein [Pseudogulbenkiania ferrooxidans]|uniref:hypothetical protein n=1 Tax=Pseudogulbenkiania ferrooxidans TaxID=549169 RepID=UPI0012371A7B|nr:hypothetical protein [Pseudogulbenkiania ferrooxidans]
MDAFEETNLAVEAFSEWSMPWLFMENILSNPSLSVAAIDVLLDVWNKALEEKYWKDADLSACSQIAKADLAANFPQLKIETIEAIVRAASYQWR